MCARRRARGFSLIEVVVFIVVLGIGIAGVVVLFSQLTVASVDPLVRKQAVAIATSLMEEIQLRGFTYCDPDDANVHTATGTGTGAGQCASSPEVIGPNEPAANAETRYADPRFDNVNDYHGFAMAGANIRDVTNAAITGLEGYSVSVAVASISPAELPDVASTDDGLRITVNVTGPAGVSVSLQGYRLRYAPNTP